MYHFGQNKVWAFSRSLRFNADWGYFPDLCWRGLFKIILGFKKTMCCLSFAESSFGTYECDDSLPQVSASSLRGFLWLISHWGKAVSSDIRKTPSHSWCLSLCESGYETLVTPLPRRSPLLSRAEMTLLVAEVRWGLRIWKLSEYFVNVTWNVVKASL